ncbi:MAG: hypothetical protein GX466_08610 [Candidatus Cloacimonetes bacterium]|nr:hypothetical protein [Candidatus Cloacimonadota bacterium]
MDDKEFGAHYVMITGNAKLVYFKAYYYCDSLPQFCYLFVTNSTDYPLKSINEANSKVIAMLKKMGYRNGCCFIQRDLDYDELNFIEMGYRLDGVTSFHLYKNMLGIDTIKIITDYVLFGKTNEKISPQTGIYDKLGCYL